MSWIGKPLVRVDGRAKVTGQARYSAEIPVAGVAYGVLVTSAIPRGRVGRSMPARRSGSRASSRS